MKLNFHLFLVKFSLHLKFVIVSKKIYTFHYNQSVRLIQKIELKVKGLK